MLSEVLQAKFWRFSSCESSQILQSIAKIYIISLACYQDEYQLSSRLTDQLLHNSLGKECPAAFWHHLRRFTIPTNAFCIKTAGIFLHSTVVAESCRIVIVSCG